jgi:hypothetical protein
MVYGVSVLTTDLGTEHTKTKVKSALWAYKEVTFAYVSTASLNFIRISIQNLTIVNYIFADHSNSAVLCVLPYTILTLESWVRTPSQHRCIYLWLYSPLLGLGRFFSLLIYTQSAGRGINPLQGRYLHTEQHKHRINAHRHPCLEWDSIPRSQCSSGRRRSMS